MRKTVTSIALVACLAGADAAQSAPMPDPPPQAVRLHRVAQLCPAPYLRVRIVTRYYRREHRHYVLVWTHKGQPFLVGGFNPHHCHRVGRTR